MKKYLLLILLTFSLPQTGLGAIANIDSSRILSYGLNKRAHYPYQFDNNPNSIVLNNVKVPEGAMYTIQGAETLIYYAKGGESLLQKILTPGGPPALDTWLAMAGTPQLVLEPMSNLNPTITISSHSKSAQNILLSSGVSFEAKLSTPALKETYFGHSELDTIALINYLANKLYWYWHLGYIWRSPVSPIMVYVNISIDPLKDAMVTIDSLEIMTNVSGSPVATITTEVMKKNGILREGSGKSPFAPKKTTAPTGA